MNLYWNVAEDEMNQTISIVQQEMENAYSLSIPLTTEARFGKNWGTMQVIQI